MSNEKKRTLFDLDSFSVVIGPEHITLSDTVIPSWKQRINGSGDGSVMFTRSMLVEIVEWLDKDEGRDALDLPRVVRVGNQGRL